MFSWFRNFKNSKDENTSYGYTNMENKVNPIPPIPNIPKNQVQDHYRIGYDSVNGATTLTLHADLTSMTLSLGPEEVMRMIRMLGATLDDDILGSMNGDADFDEDED